MEIKPTTTVEAVCVKVPPFWPEEPALWFAQLEGQFVLASITADSKYNYVISNLEFKYVSENKDIVKNPPGANNYDKVKTELIPRLSSSQEQRVRQLLTHEDIGDRKPAQILTAPTKFGRSERTRRFCTFYLVEAPANECTGDYCVAA